MRAKNFLGSFLLLSTSTLLAVLAAEIFLRADFMQTNLTNEDSFLSEFPYQYSSTRHHSLMKNARYRHTSEEYNYIWENNQYGMRDRLDRKLDQAKKGVFLFLGDSMTQGYGVSLENSALYLLEEIISRTHTDNPKIIVNASVFGYSPVLERIYLQELLREIVPEMVFAVIYLGNDIGDDNFYTEYLDEHHPAVEADINDVTWPWSYTYVLDEKNSGAQQAASTEHNNALPSSLRSTSYMAAKKGLKKVVSNSRIWRKIRVFVTAQKQEYLSRSELARIRDLKAEYKTDIRVNSGLVNHDILSKHERRLLWQPTLNALIEMNALCQLNGVGFGIIVIPIVDGSVTYTGSGVFEEPFQVLESLAVEQGFNFYNVLDMLQEHELGDLVFELDGHFNEEGNKLLSQYLYNYLERSGFTTGL